MKIFSLSFLPVIFAVFSALTFPGAARLSYSAAEPQDKPAAAPVPAPPPAPDFKDTAKFGNVVSAKAIVRVRSSGQGDFPELHGSLVRGPEPQHRAFITAREEFPWLILDLRETQLITGLHILNATVRKTVTDPNAKTDKRVAKSVPVHVNKPLTVELSTDAETWTNVFVASAEDPGLDWKIDLGTKAANARYMRIGLKQDVPRPFLLKRVTVYGKPPGTPLLPPTLSATPETKPPTASPAAKVAKPAANAVPAKAVAQAAATPVSTNVTPAAAPAKKAAPGGTADLAVLRPVLDAALDLHDAPDVLSALENDLVFRKAIAIWRLAQNCGPDNLAVFFADPANAAFADWLLVPPQRGARSPLETYLLNRPRVGKKDSVAPLQTWASIWKIDPESRSGLWLNVAIGHALATAPDADEAAVGAHIARYIFTKQSRAAKKYFPDFDNLAAWEHRFIGNIDKPVSELEWCQRYLADKRPDFTPANIGRSGNIIPYRLKNLKGIHIYERERDKTLARITKSRAYYDYMPYTFELQLSVGGVCVEISTLSIWFSLSKGIPAARVGQPNHLALIYRPAPHTWRIGNDIYNWHRSTMRGELFEWARQPSVIFLFDDFQSDPAAAFRSDLALWAAQYLASRDALSATRLVLLETGIAACPSNYDLYTEQVLALNAAKATQAEWQRHALALASAFREHPLVLSGLLANYTKHFLPAAATVGTPAEATHLEWLKTLAAILASPAKNRTGPLGPSTGFASCLAEQLAQVGLPKNQVRQIGQLDVKPDFWKKVPENKRALVDSLLRGALESSLRQPLLAGAVVRGYYNASLSEPDRLERARLYFAELLVATRREGRPESALTLARLLVRGAAENYNAESVAWNTFQVLQIRLENAPKNIALWRELTPVLLANAALSSKVEAGTRAFLKTVQADETKYSKQVRLFAAKHSVL